MNPMVEQPSLSCTVFSLSFSAPTSSSVSAVSSLVQSSFTCSVWSLRCCRFSELDLFSVRCCRLLCPALVSAGYLQTNPAGRRLHQCTSCTTDPHSLSLDAPCRWRKDDFCLMHCENTGMNYTQSSWDFVYQTFYSQYIHLPSF